MYKLFSPKSIITMQRNEFNLSGGDDRRSLSSSPQSPVKQTNTPPHI